MPFPLYESLGCPETMKTTGGGSFYLFFAGARSCLEVRGREDVPLLPDRVFQVRAGVSSPILASFINSCISSQGLQGSPGRHAAGPQVPPSRGRGRGQDGLGRLQGPLPLHLPVRAGRGAEGAARRDGGQPLALGLFSQRAPTTFPLGLVSAGTILRMRISV